MVMVGTIILVIASLATVALVVDRLLGHLYWPDRTSGLRDFQEGMGAIRHAVENREIKKSRV